MSDKPLIFISHSSLDKDIALKLKNEWEKSWTQEGKSSSQIEVFASTAPNAIMAGDDWFTHVIGAIQKADILVVLLTENSIDRPWIWFEIGFFWNRKLSDQKSRILPLYRNGVSIPSPLNLLQAKSIDDPSEYAVFIATLVGFITAKLYLLPE